MCCIFRPVIRIISWKRALYCLRGTEIRKNQAPFWHLHPPAMRNQRHFQFKHFWHLWPSAKMRLTPGPLDISGIKLQTESRRSSLGSFCPKLHSQSLRPIFINVISVTNLKERTGQITYNKIPTSSSKCVMCLQPEVITKIFLKEKEKPWSSKCVSYLWNNEDLKC